MAHSAPEINASGNTSMPVAAAQARLRKRIASAISSRDYHKYNSLVNTQPWIASTNAWRHCVAQNSKQPLAFRSALASAALVAGFHRRSAFRALLALLVAAAESRRP